MIPGDTAGPSSVPTARASLFTLLEANATFSGDTSIAVIFDDPTLGDETRSDYVSVGRVQQTEQPFTMRGGLLAAETMLEKFTIEVIVCVFRAGDEAQTVFERCWTLINAVRTTVRTDPTLSGSVVQSWPESWDVQTSWDTQAVGRWAIGTGQIYCENPL